MISAIAALVLAACSDGAAAPSIRLGSTIVALAPGVEAEVATTLRSPTLHPEGRYDAYTGRVVISVRIGPKDAVETDIGSLIGRDELNFFSPSVALVFTDYNNDGRPDFNLGQQCGSNNFCYWLFTIEPSGAVSLMPFAGSKQVQFLWINDDVYSTHEIGVAPDGISWWNYDPSEGAGVTYRARWSAKEKAFVFLDRRVAGTDPKGP